MLARMPCAIALEGVSKRYGDAVVLHETNLEVPYGRALAIIGPSGCGKSTLLRIIIGLTQPDLGRVHVNGEIMSPATYLALRRRMGYVIQEGGLFPHLTARKNVSMMADHLRWDRARTKERVEELRALVELPRETLDRYPAELSGGQRHRVGLMRALLLDPAILLLDEPLGALDAISRGQLQRDLVAIFERLDKTVLVVTHDIKEAATLGDELVVMDAGRIVQRGTLEEVSTRPETALVSELLGQRGNT